MIQALMSPQEKASAIEWANTENRRLANDIVARNVNPSQTLGKDDFLRILITQLAHQDPTAPVQDTEFIAQMASFSTLEQMTNMAADFALVARLMQGSEATAALGKAVELHTATESIQGIVQAVTREEIPHVMVNGRFYAWEQVVAVFDQQAAQGNRGE